MVCCCSSPCLSPGRFVSLQEEKTQKPSWKRPRGKKAKKVTPDPDPTLCPFIITLKEKCSSSCVGWCVAVRFFVKPVAACISPEQNPS